MRLCLGYVEVLTNKCCSYWPILKPFNVVLGLSVPHQLLFVYFQVFRMSSCLVTDLYHAGIMVSWYCYGNKPCWAPYNSLNYLVINFHEWKVCWRLQLAKRPNDHSVIKITEVPVLQTHWKWLAEGEVIINLTTDNHSKLCIQQKHWLIPLNRQVDLSCFIFISAQEHLWKKKNLMVATKMVIFSFKTGCQ